MIFPPTQGIHNSWELHFFCCQLGHLTSLPRPRPAQSSTNLCQGRLSLWTTPLLGSRAKPAQSAFNPCQGRLSSEALAILSFCRHLRTLCSLPLPSLAVWVIPTPNEIYKISPPTTLQISPPTTLQISPPTTLQISPPPTLRSPLHSGDLPSSFPEISPAFWRSPLLFGDLVVNKYYLPCVYYLVKVVVRGSLE